MGFNLQMFFNELTDLISNIENDPLPVYNDNYIDELIKTIKWNYKYAKECGLIE